MAHEHNILDRDPHFIIDADTRTINASSVYDTSLMQYDHNSERLTFEIPSEIEDHKMVDSDLIQIHYINIGANGKRNEGVYLVDDAQLTADGSTVRFTWLVSQEATQNSGTLSFAIRFSCGPDPEYPEYIWNSAIYNSIPIGTGMNNAAVITTKYADILGQWYNELLGYGGKVAKEIAPTLEAEIEEEKLAAIAVIRVQADEIVNLVLERMPQAEDQILGTVPQAEEASF